MADFADRVKDTTTTTGTGAITLAGSAPAGYRTFASAFATGSRVWYCIEAVDGSGVPTGEWEVGYGTLTAGTTLARTKVTASSNSNALVNFSAGTKNAFCTISALRMGESQTTGRDDMARRAAFF